MSNNSGKKLRKLYFNLFLNYNLKNNREVDKIDLLYNTDAYIHIFLHRV